MMKRHRFSINAGGLACVLLAGSLLAGCSAQSGLAGTGASPLPVSPSRTAYEPSAAETPEPEAKAESGTPAEQTQTRETYLDDSLAGWKIEAQINGKSNIDNTLYATRDGGQEWKKIDDSRKGSFPSGSVGAVRFADERRGWVSVDTPQEGNPLLFETRDGGLSWSPTALKIPADFRTARFRPKAPLLFSGTELGLFIAQADYAAGSGEENPLLFYVTSDGGETWSDPLRSEQGELHGLSWKTKRLADETGRAWSITIEGRTWTFERGDE
ncbi:WD40/YVTN/BNR-like repeat-containing protein [Saccharibacillus alkalitolerans]|uniref:Photosynthesis system II assembly factor Ycf48/Hcf136-like domain-containing protein n=1 Tax=Saccharibacillus alkalitolerans TaxID=2705290 RepID=A0ABX0F5C8_9BACL|nr:hypothetical protein [Saccharibacillus alkalitolerans]NGZ75219.1 hypothetical protein [Saccharibacillus alkalitolerans]